MSSAQAKGSRVERELVRLLTKKGAMNGIISSNNMDIEKMQSLLTKHPSMEGKDLAKVVTCKKSYFINKLTISI